MGIELTDPAQAAGTPVMKRKRIGERSLVAIIDKPERRPSLDSEGNPRLNAKGNPASELVIHCIAVDGDMQAGLGGVNSIPDPGEVVRHIFAKGAYGAWIEAENEFKAEHGRGLNVGDMIGMTTEFGEVYTDGGSRKEKNVTTQAEVDAIMPDRSKTVGLRGKLFIRPAKPEEQQHVGVAEVAYHARQQANSISLPPAGTYDKDTGEEYF